VSASEPLNQQQPPPRFTKDTLADKAIRFGCGFVLALLVVTALVLFGILEPLGLRGVVVLGAVFASVTGVLSATQGERVILGLLRLIKWRA
jgi:hypothetical protein